MNPSDPPGPRRAPQLLATAGLATVFAALLALANWHYLFHESLYECGDQAANSLSVLRAERFSQIYGHYSRWGFRHPGPGMFYALGLGEKVFWQWLHVVPAGYNAQVLMEIIIMSSFLAAALTTVAGWVRSAFFLPLALLAAALHLTAVDPTTCLLSCWPPEEMVLPLALLLIAGASVAAGEGAGLPLLILIGCLLIHLYVAQPLFVLPAFGLAYAGLAWSCWRRGRIGPGVSALPWRVYPRSHWAAALIAAAFMLPLAVDAIHGSPSNLSLILEHMRDHSGERHSWLSSVYYFLCFGAYKPSGGEHIFERQTSDLPRFVETHWKLLGIWVCALLLPLAAVLFRRPRMAVAPPPGRWRFLGWLIAFWALAAGLTLYWGHVQDGDMFYFNAWFDYGIYFVLALIGAAALSDILEAGLEGRRHASAWRAAIILGCLLLAGVRVETGLDSYRARFGASAEDRQPAQAVLAALAAEPGQRRPKLLEFPHESWPAAVTVAALLERQHCPFFIEPDWACMFGDEYVMRDGARSRLIAGGDGQPPVDVWRILPAASVPATAPVRALRDGCVLSLQMDVDPNQKTVIAFAGNQVNCELYTVMGWSPPAPDAGYAWSEGEEGFLRFHPAPVPPNSAVEIVFDFRPNDLLGAGFPERLQVSFNRTDLGTQTLVVGESESAPLPRVRIPAALWNATSSAVLRLGFPDAVSPLEKGLSSDPRKLGFVTRDITFQVIPAAVPSPL